MEEAKYYAQIIDSIITGVKEIYSNKLTIDNSSLKALVVEWGGDEDYFYDIEARVNWNEDETVSINHLLKELEYHKELYEMELK